MASFLSYLYYLEVIDILILNNFFFFFMRFDRQYYEIIYNKYYTYSISSISGLNCRLVSGTREASAVASAES